MVNMLNGLNVTIESQTDDSQYVEAVTSAPKYNTIQVYDNSSPDEVILNCIVAQMY